MFDYDRARLPNPYLAQLEATTDDLEGAKAATGLSIGYPAWNLLYYALRCSLRRKDPVVIESGTNRGSSTIILAQALEDVGAETKLITCDIDAELVEIAKKNASNAGLAHRIEFRVGDSLELLEEISRKHEQVDFAFLDGSHRCDHVVAEFEWLHPRIQKTRGTVYFDNTSRGEVADALNQIQRRFGGNLVQFDNCSWSPPGNSIWQP